MRAGELLGSRVSAGDGHSLGAVHDMRLRRTPAGEIVITGLIVGPGAVGSRLGYVYGDVAGPALLAWLLRRFGRRAVYVPWERLERQEDGSLRVLGDPGDLQHPAGGEAT